MSAADIKAKIPYAVSEKGPYGWDTLSVHSGPNVLRFYVDRSGTVQMIVAGKPLEAGYECE